MRYMAFVKMAEDVGEAPPALQEAMGQAMAEAFAAGSMIDVGGLYPTAQSTEVRVANGVVNQIDGPYTEAKEVVGGYAILEARSHEEAVEGARRVAQLHVDFWPGWEGSVEVRRIAGPEEGPPAGS